MNDWRNRLSDQEQRLLKETSHPEWISPMQATLTDKRFSDEDWIYEPKLDGERLLAFRRSDEIRLMTRNRKSASSTYPEIIDALEQQSSTDFVADGEIVAFRNGISSFSRLQQRMKINDPDEAREHPVGVRFYLFDLPYLDGCSLERLPLRTRKKILRARFRFDDPIRFTTHRNGTGEAFFSEACRKGWEGVIAKRAESSYRRSRSRDWLKFKCEKGQELVIGGFTEPQGERSGFGALLVGYYQNDRLCYAGKVGTGYDDQFLRDFHRRLMRIETRNSPFEDAPSDSRVTWVQPKYVGEFGFTEWTEDSKLRHPRFLGLRRDKNARDVIRETTDE